MTKKNVTLARENDVLKRGNEAARRAHAAAGESFKAVSAHVATLGNANARLKKERKHLVRAADLLKEELAMKQAIYAAQVASFSKLRNVMETMVETADARGVEPGVVEELRVLAGLRLHDDGIAAPPPPPVDESPGFLRRLSGRFLGT